MDLFNRQWATYRQVVDQDLMEHRALSTAVAKAIDTWMESVGSDRGKREPPRLVDLGCGDLGLLAPLLRRLPLGSYLGIDLSAQVLPLAAAALGPVAYPCRWRELDLLSWAAADNPAQPVDILHSAFAIHHLSDGEKARFLDLCRRRIAPGGLFLWADVFRQPGESRDAYGARYVERIRNTWTELSQEERERVVTHLLSFDHPADPVVIQAAAAAAGWRWKWLWRGTHQAEALALLTPA
jgi:cyclopropane fatty-acyl-phospholipid synthase-like methyltransferase